MRHWYAFLKSVLIKRLVNVLPNSDLQRRDANSSVAVNVLRNTPTHWCLRNTKYINGYAAQEDNHFFFDELQCGHNTHLDKENHVKSIHLCCSDLYFCLYV